MTKKRLTKRERIFRQINPNPGTPRFEVTIRGEDPVVFENYEDAKKHYDGLGMDVDKALWDLTNDLDKLDSHSTPLKMNAKEKAHICHMTEDIIRHKGGMLETIPGLIRKIINNRCWEELDLTDKPYAQGTVKYSSLRDMIEGKLLEGGWNTTTEHVERFLRDDPETLAMFQKEVGTTPSAMEAVLEGYKRLSEQEKKDLLQAINNL